MLAGKAHTGIQKKRNSLWFGVRLSTHRSLQETWPSETVFLFYSLFNLSTSFFVYFFNKDFIYLFLRDIQREAETQAEGEAGSLQEPGVGLDPRTPRSRPEPKADAQPLSPPDVPNLSSSESSLQTQYHPRYRKAAQCSEPPLIASFNSSALLWSAFAVCLSF